MTIYYTVYKTTNLVNGREYIGVHKTKDLDDGYIGSGTAIKQAIEKYGRENFSKEILEFCENEDEMYKSEALLVDEDWVNNPNTYNLVEGGQGGWKGMLSKPYEERLAHCRAAGLIGTMRAKELGVGIHALTKEQLSKQGKNSAILKKGVHGLDEETRKENARRGGLKGGKSTRAKGAGIFKRTKEEWSIQNKINGSKAPGFAKMDPDQYARVLERSREGQKFWRETAIPYTDGIKTHWYSYNEQQDLPFEEFLKQNPGFKKGKGRHTFGIVYYNDGVENYHYSVEEQEQLPFEEFLKQNPNLVKGMREGTKGNLKGAIVYNNGKKTLRYTVDEQEQLPFEEFLKQNPDFKKGYHARKMNPNRPKILFRYYTDGVKTYTYKSRDMEKLPFEEFLKQNPQFRAGKPLNKKKSRGSKNGF